MDSEPMCRACLSESGDAVPIFSSAETSGVQMPLSDMMMACSSVQVLSGDGLPGLICLDCLRSLLVAFEFKLKCEKTDAMLREYIENNLIPMQVGTIYNKSVTVDSNNLVPINAASSGEIKQIVGTNELISAIPTIAINNANTIYSNANPYIIPMVECDVLVKEEQDNMNGSVENKNYQKCIPSTSEASVMLKKIGIDSQSNNATVDMTFSPRIIPSEMIQPSQQQITIYSPDFRVSEEQTTLVMPKIDGMSTINSMAQCNVLTTNTYSLDQTQCNAIIQNNIVTGANGQPTNNNFINAMALPSNMTFEIKDNILTGRKRASAIMAVCNKTGKTENVLLEQHSHTNIISNLENLHTFQIKDVRTLASNNDTNDQLSDSPSKKPKAAVNHTKKKPTTTTNPVEPTHKPRAKFTQKDNKTPKTLTGLVNEITTSSGCLSVNSSSEIPMNQIKNINQLHHHSNQGFIR